MIYFGSTDRFVKVGFSDAVSRRVKDHARDNGFVPLAFMPGDRILEKAIHRAFRKWRWRCDGWGDSEERFTLESPVLDYAATLVERGYATPDEEIASMLPVPPVRDILPGALSKSAVDASGQLSIACRLDPPQRVALAAASGFNSSLSDEWYTGAEWIELARSVMGSIDTDPATSQWVNAQHIRAPLFYTKETNGLDRSRRWQGHVWINPPYGSGDCSAGAFMLRLVEEFASGAVTQAITCLNLASMCSMWFYTTLPQIASAHCVPFGRPNFKPPAGQAASAPNKGTVFTYCGPRLDRFVEVFGGHGQLLLPARGSL